MFGTVKAIEEYGIPNPNASDVEGVVVIGYDPAIKKWLALEWSNKNTIWLAGGGKEKSETYEQTAIRELKEETGYSDFEEMIQLGGPIVSHYYNEKKDVFRRSYSFSYLFLLNSKDRGTQELEDHEKFEILWLEYEALCKALVKTGGGVEHWLAVLSRANDYIKQANYK